MPTPTETLLTHLPALRTAFIESHGSVTGAWHYLAATCPSIAASMALNSFRVVAPVIVATVNHLQPPRPPALKLPPNYRGWSTSLDKSDKIRLHRRFDGRLYSLYIGAVWDAEKAAQRITAFERKRLEVLCNAV